MYQLCFVQTVDGFGQRVVIAVPLTTHRGLNSGLCQALTVSDGNVLRAPIAMMNQGVIALWLASCPAPETWVMPELLSWGGFGLM